MIESSQDGHMIDALPPAEKPRGRPTGSKNKKTDAIHRSQAEDKSPEKMAQQDIVSKALKLAGVNDSSDLELQSETLRRNNADRAKKDKPLPQVGTKRKGGRPKGSKNKNRRFKSPAKKGLEKVDSKRAIFEKANLEGATTEPAQEREVKIVEDATDEDFEDAIVKLMCPLCLRTFNSIPDTILHLMAQEKIQEVNHEVLKLVSKQMRRLRCKSCLSVFYSEHLSVSRHYYKQHKLLVVDEVRANPKKYFDLVEADREVERNDDVVAHYFLIMGRLWQRFCCPWCQYYTFDWGFLARHVPSSHDKEMNCEEMLSLASSPRWKVLCKICRSELCRQREATKRHFWEKHGVEMGDVYEDVAKFIVRSDQIQTLINSETGQLEYVEEPVVDDESLAGQGIMEEENSAMVGSDGVSEDADAKQDEPSRDALEEVNDGQESNLEDNLSGEAASKSSTSKEKLHSVDDDGYKMADAGSLGFGNVPKRDESRAAQQKMAQEESPQSKNVTDEAPGEKSNESENPGKTVPDKQITSAASENLAKKSLGESAHNKETSLSRAPKLPEHSTDNLLPEDENMTSAWETEIDESIEKDETSEKAENDVPTDEGRQSRVSTTTTSCDVEESIETNKNSHENQIRVNSLPDNDAGTATNEHRPMTSLCSHATDEATEKSGQDGSENPSNPECNAWYEGTANIVADKDDNQAEAPTESDATNQVAENIVADETDFSAPAKVDRRFDTNSLFPHLKCPWCPLAILSFTDLQHHVFKKHGKSRYCEELLQERDKHGQAKCNLCKLTMFYTSEDLRHHFKGSHRILRQDLTRDHFIVLNDNVHNINNINNSDKIVCNIRTAANHGPLSVHCTLCGDGFEKKSHFLQHVEHEHPEMKGQDAAEEWFNRCVESKGVMHCGECGILLESTIIALRLHLYRKHQTRDLAEYLSKHEKLIREQSEIMKFAAEASLECFVCFRMVDGSRGLISHLIRDHRMRKKRVQVWMIMQEVAKRSGIPYSVKVDNVEDVEEETGRDQNIQDDEAERSKRHGKVKRNCPNSPTKSVVGNQVNRQPTTNVANERVNLDALEVFDGCVYRCQHCNKGKSFGCHNLSRLRGHIDKNHPKESLLPGCVKGSRISEVSFTCPLCEMKVVRDRIEAGHHAWTEHKLDLTAYARKANKKN